MEWHPAMKDQIFLKSYFKKYKFELKKYITTPITLKYLLINSFHYIIMCLKIVTGRKLCVSIDIAYNCIKGKKGTLAFIFT